MASQALPDFRSLKNTALNYTATNGGVGSPSHGEEEQVQVNQRHLIDKILARYSAPFTIFRELMQNSNDAGAVKAQISFTTNASFIKPGFLGTKANVQVTAITYRNNGRPFAPEDFSRLRKIAEGNPDEQKIGFFGVGFYSLFSVAEEPFVVSGKESLAFLWRGDMLFTRRGVIPDGSVSEWTSFFLDLREPMDIPNLPEFGKFLCTSLAFTSNLRSVEVLVDEQVVISFTKKVSEARELTLTGNSAKLPRGTPTKIMNVRDMNVSNVQLDVGMRKGFDLSRDRYGEMEDRTVFYRIATATLNVTLPTAMVKEMERTTKKKPPSTTPIRIIYSNYDEFDGSRESRVAMAIFDDLIPSPQQQGRIFIGFPTHQTTGISCLIAGHFIPTVERESIDFVDRTLNAWNQDVLYMCGLFARYVYHDDMYAIQRLYAEIDSHMDSESEGWLQRKGAHAMAAFFFRPSTPAGLVGQILNIAFFSSLDLPLMTSRGVMPVGQVRVVDLAARGFVKQTPYLTDKTTESCRELIAALQSGGHLKSFNIEDMITEASSRSFEGEEMIAFMKWFIAYRRDHALSPSEMMNLQGRLTFLSSSQSTYEIEKASKSMECKAIKFHVPQKLIPPELPLPPTALPIDISKHFSKADLETHFWGWKELMLIDWARYVCELSEFKSNSEFVEHVMATISRHFSSISNEQKGWILSYMATKACIVTKAGLKLPTDSYFKNVDLFQDLPIIAFANPKSVSEVFCRALGVRDMVDLQLIFDRLTDLNWDHYMLVKYLASVRDKLNPVEISRLAATALFPKQGTENESSRFKASDLFAPIEAITVLGFPILSWKSKWKPGTEEAKLMETLGLQSIVPLPALFDKVSQAEDPANLLQYFIANFRTHYSSIYRATDVKVPILPISKLDGSEPQKRPILAHPLECFSDAGASCLGFLILHADYTEHASKFGVLPHPSADITLEAIRKQRIPVDQAQKIFTYLSSRQGEFTKSHWHNLRQMSFIPVISKSGATVWADPSAVFFSQSGGDKAAQDNDPFLYVDFGSSANSFLRSCGVQDQPTPLQMAQNLVKSPQVFLDAYGIEKYLSTLRLLAANMQFLSQQTGLVKEMRIVKFLIAFQVQPASMKDEKADGTSQYQLASASEIFLVDDSVLGQLFSPLSAPHETILESMYEYLGSRWLSENVQESTIPKGNRRASRASQELHDLIQERTPLLIYDNQQQFSQQDILPGSEKRLRAVSVAEVPEIEITRTFLKQVQVQRTTCCILKASKKEEYILFITPEYDYFDVANALGKIIFRKGRLKDALLLSTLLSTSLLNLKRKGFPVDRILNLTKQQHLAPAPVVVQPPRPPSLPTGPDTKKHSTPVSRASSAPSIDDNRSNNDPSDAVSRLKIMFPDVDEEFLLAKIAENPVDTVEKVTYDFLDNGYKKRSGSPPAKPGPAAPTGLVGNLFEAMDTATGGIMTSLFSGGGGSSGPKPAFNPYPGLRSGGGNISRPDPPSTGGGRGDITSRPPPIAMDRNQNVQRMLKQSISSLRSTDESFINANIPADPPPDVLKNAISNECSVIANENLSLLDRVDGMPFYADARVLEQAKSVLSGSRQGLERFALILKFLAQNVFGADVRTVHLYWDSAGKTIAFNRGKTLFFNARFYLGLHYVPRADSISSPMPGSFGASSQLSKSPPTLRDEYYETFAYWFMTYCHELAHNFIHEHNAEHEYWMSTFAETYMRKLVRHLADEGIKP